jgi:hypothetical protein
MMGIIKINNMPVKRLETKSIVPWPCERALKTITKYKDVIGAEDKNAKAFAHFIQSSF